MAVDPLRHRRLAINGNPTKELRAGPLLALAGRLDEILDSFFVACRSWKPPGVVARIYWNECRIVFCDGGGRRALHAAGALCDFSGPFLIRFIESDSVAPVLSRGDLALWIPGRRFRLVHALASGFPCPAACGAIARRTRSRNAAPAGTDCGDRRRTCRAGRPGPSPRE